ncbi:MAG: hypothetical protein FWB78_12785, partial [Treponema sp.]|nr:hypothetical protein [Treponema sp.]
MKRQLLFFVIVMILCGTAWGQTLGHEDDDDDWYHWRDYMPGMGHRGRVNLNVVPRLSTGARNSAGLFRSYTDNFIDPRFYCRDIDTFFFVGANIPYENRHVNAGFARSFNSLYLALYYGGGFVRGYRERRGEDTAEYLPNEMERETSWKNNLALLLGFGEAMGIRLDVAVHSETIRMARRGSMGGPGVTEDNLTQIRFNYGPSFALTWGARFGSLAPWARVGYRVPNLHLSDYETSQHGTRISNYSRLRTGGAMEISGGARFELGEVSSIGGEIWLGNTFPDRLDRSHSSPGSVPPNYNVTDRRG